MRHRSVIRLSASLLAALTTMLTACGGTTNPQRYSALCEAATTEVSIPDATLRAAIRAELGKPAGPITCADMEQVTSIDSQRSEISDLTGLQFAINLENLNLTGNRVTDLGPLTNLTKLRHLNMNGNPFASFEPLRKLTNLEELHLCCNETRITDVSPLEGLTKLRAININGYELGDAVVWPLLAKFPDLSGLWIGRNDLQDLSPLLNYKHAFAIELVGTHIPDLAILSEFSNLTWLDLNNAVLGDLTPLHSMTRLTYLNLTGTGLHDLGFLAGLPQLETVILLDNAVRDLAPLVTSPGIGSGDYIDLMWNPLDPDDAAVQADVAELQSKGVSLRLNLGEQTRYSHVGPPVEATLDTVIASYPEAAGLYGAVVGAYRLNIPDDGEGEWTYTFYDPVMPFQVEEDGSFEVLLETPTTLSTRLAGDCDFTTTWTGGLSPFFNTPVTQTLTANPVMYAGYPQGTGAYYQNFWYSVGDQHIDCVIRNAAGAPNSQIMEYDLLLRDGWNTVLMYRSDLANGQRYYSARTGTSVGDDGVLHLSAP